MSIVGSWPTASRSWAERADLWLSQLYEAQTWTEPHLAASLRELFIVESRNHYGDSFPCIMISNGGTQNGLLMRLLLSDRTDFRRHEPPLSEEEWNAMFRTFWSLIVHSPLLSAKYDGWYKESAFSPTKALCGWCILGLQITDCMDRVASWKWPSLEAVLIAGVTAASPSSPDGLLFLKRLTEYIGGEGNLTYKQGRPLIRQLWTLALHSWCEWQEPVPRWTVKYHTLMLRTVREEVWTFDAVHSEDLRAICEITKSHNDWANWQSPWALYAHAVTQYVLPDEPDAWRPKRIWSADVLLHLATLFLPIVGLAAVTSSMKRGMESTYGKPGMKLYQRKAFGVLVAELSAVDRWEEHVSLGGGHTLEELEPALCLYLVEEQHTMTELEWKSGPAAVYINRLEHVTWRDRRLTQENLDLISPFLAAPFKHETGPGDCATAFRDFWKATFGAASTELNYPPSLEPAIKYFVERRWGQALHTTDNADVTAAVLNYPHVAVSSPVPEEGPSNSAASKSSRIGNAAVHRSRRVRLLLPVEHAKETVEPTRSKQAKAISRARRQKPARLLLDCVYIPPFPKVHQKETRRPVGGGAPGLVFDYVAVPVLVKRTRGA